jgi:hypothetical protein
MAMIGNGPVQAEAPKMMAQLTYIFHGGFNGVYKPTYNRGGFILYQLLLRYAPTARSVPLTSSGAKTFGNFGEV